MTNEYLVPVHQLLPCTTVMELDVHPVEKKRNIGNTPEASQSPTA
jgi:hypothetical protein